MEECPNLEKRKTPYFIPKTAPATVEGVARLREEFYGAVRSARLTEGHPLHAAQDAVDLLDRLGSGFPVSHRECSDARDGLKALLAANRGRKSSRAKR
jgi:hypothetical protein